MTFSGIERHEKTNCVSQKVICILFGLSDNYWDRKLCEGVEMVHNKVKMVPNEIQEDFLAQGSSHMPMINYFLHYLIGWKEYNRSLEFWGSNYRADIWTDTLS